MRHHYVAYAQFDAGRISPARVKRHIARTRDADRELEHPFFQLVTFVPIAGAPFERSVAIDGENIWGSGSVSGRGAVIVNTFAVTATGSGLRAREFVRHESSCE